MRFSITFIFSAYLIVCFLLLVLCFVCAGYQIADKLLAQEKGMRRERVGEKWREGWVKQ